MTPDCAGSDTFTRDFAFAHPVIVSPQFFDRLLSMAGRCCRGPSAWMCRPMSDDALPPFDARAFFGANR